MGRLSLLALTITLAFAACAGDAHAARLYSVTRVPKPPLTSASGSALNDAGHVVGWASPTSGPPAGFYWSPETGLVSLGENGIPLSVNNHDVVVGRHPTAEALRPMRAFIWDPQTRTLQDLPSSTMATDVNEAGQVAYRFELNGVPVGSFIRDADGTVRQLPDGQDGRSSGVNGLGERGDAVGAASLPGESARRAVYWSTTGELRRLPDPPGIQSDGANAINGSGLVVGSGVTDPASPDPGRMRALLWDLATGEVRDLGTLAGQPGAKPLSINDAGEVVGASGSYFGSPDSHAFLWTEDEGMLDLNSLLDESGQGVTLFYARAINNRGQILANTLSGTVLLTPVPEPATGLVLPSFALVALLRRRRRLSVAMNA